MAKNKGTRILITLECTECRSNLNKRSPGVSRYSTQKNRRNNPGMVPLVNLPLFLFYFSALVLWPTLPPRAIQYGSFWLFP